MRLVALLLILASHPVFADEQSTINYQCLQEMTYTGIMIRAREVGKTEEELQTELDKQADRYQQSDTREYRMMKKIIEIVFSHKIETFDEQRKVLDEVNDACEMQLPLPREQRKNLDEDGDGIPDYDGNGDPIQTLSV